MAKCICFLNSIEFTRQMTNSLTDLKHMHEELNPSVGDVRLSECQGKTPCLSTKQDLSGKEESSYLPHLEHSVKFIAVLDTFFTNYLLKSQVIGLSAIRTSFLQPQQQAKKDKNVQFASGCAKGLFSASSLTESGTQKTFQSCCRKQSSMNLIELGRQERISKKQLLKRIFQLQNVNRDLQHRVRTLSLELSEMERRQEKEMVKKRESLQMLAEDISEKNEVIDELKATIRRFQSKCTSSHHILDDVLEEDAYNLKKTVFRLQNINEKLNDKAEDDRREKCFLTKQINELSVEIDAMKGEKKLLLQKNYQMEMEMKKYEEKQNEFEYKTKKLRRKMEIMQRRKMSKSVEEQTSVEEMNVGSEVELEEKIEAIFTYLFNIEEKEFQIKGNFDEDEKRVLVQLKQKIIQNKGKNVIQNISLCQRKSCFGKEMCQFQDQSILKAFQGILSDKNIINYQLEKENQNRKISQMKDFQMHVRSIILNIMKSLQIKSMKKQTGDMFNILFQVFEYSEEQKKMIFPPQKKLFGFI